jgi:Predicted secreted protein (DUF2259)
MKNNLQLAFTFLVLAVFSSFALADNPAQVDVIGFSQSGKYFAFAEYGNNDDKDDKSSYSIMYIINVAKNRLAVAPFRADGTWNIKGTRALHRIYGQDVKKRLRRFGIGEGFTDGTFSQALMVENLDSDKPTIRSRNRETSYNEMNVRVNFGGLNIEREFEVTLSKVLSPLENCIDFKRDMFSFELILKYKNREPLTLQNEGKVCADAYGIESVFVYRNKFAVVVASLSKNAKGPDNRYLVVTGAIPVK